MRHCKAFLSNMSLIIMLVCAVATSFATIMPSNSNYYYQLGGGSDVSMPAVTENQHITLNGNINSGLGFTCDNFNPAIAISDTVNDIENSIQGLESSVIESATAAVGSMAMYLLEKSNKDLYNLIQNTMTGAQDTFNISMKSCQQALSEISKDSSPYQDWFKVSDSQGWLSESKRAGQGQSVDINKAKDNIAQNPGRYGVPWVHGGANSGGTIGNQAPIQVIYDAVVAGYNVMVDAQNPLDAKTTAAAKGSGLAQFWPTANDAGFYATLVLGDITISAMQNHDQTKRGIGLLTLMQTCPDSSSHDLTCANVIANHLKNIVVSNAIPSSEQLAQVSSQQMLATPALIHAIRNQSTIDQSLSISKWSQDVALQNTINEASTLIRVLLTAQHIKVIHNLRPATVMITQAINELNDEINAIQMQINFRNTMMSNTAQTILGNEKVQESYSANENIPTQEPDVVSGAIYKSSN